MYKALVFCGNVCAQIALGQTPNTITITVKNHDTKANIADAVVRIKDTKISAAEKRTARHAD